MCKKIIKYISLYFEDQLTNERQKKAFTTTTQAQADNQSLIFGKCLTFIDQSKTSDYCY